MPQTRSSAKLATLATPCGIEANWHCLCRGLAELREQTKKIKTPPSSRLCRPVAYPGEACRVPPVDNAEIHCSSAMRADVASAFLAGPPLPMLLASEFPNTENARSPSIFFLSRTSSNIRYGVKKTVCRPGSGSVVEPVRPSTLKIPLPYAVSGTIFETFETSTTGALDRKVFVAAGFLLLPPSATAETKPHPLSLAPPKLQRGIRRSIGQLRALIFLDMRRQCHG